MKKLILILFLSSITTFNCKPEKEHLNFDNENIIICRGDSVIICNKDSVDIIDSIK